ncbi:proteasome-activating nucleotidase [Candidatus Woesearchaeota archaeon]|nr:MAG: proteasome-activating nucleotidase [Candidatus Woesearchaeota archaeon]
MGMGNTNNGLDKAVYSYAYSYSQLEEENRILRETVGHMRERLNRFMSKPLMVCEVKDVLKDGVLIKIPNGNQFCVNFLPELKLAPGDTVLVEQKNLTIVKKIDTTSEFNVERFVIIEKPTVTFKDIGGLKEQIREIKEVIELPLTNPELFKRVGIQPPKGILLHGDSGTGKTLLAKAVANSTNATFIEIVASELVQKFIGEGAKLVKEIFDLAKKKAPSIVFIDELDALASKRIELGTSGEREVQRTFMQLLAEIDGFKTLGNVKVIGCTNRKDILDPAIIRPGRLDRLIEVPLPDEEGRMEILGIHTRRMNLRGVNKQVLVKKMVGFSGAEIKAVCTEAGYFAIRDKRDYVTQEDFLNAINKVLASEERDGEEYLHMFG